ncbi:hypothetical protein N5E96_20410 [Pseudomonas mosselii]|uniref:hypothetical protein n=1 Tax=Pseudomonas TaxID=286 RepID=UPI0016447CD2|nr:MULTISPECIES: hypothetical protein [Pseudomonas]MBC3436798.1 hypothetical protein [Pseudomonas sp. BW16M2]MDH1657052.1 hypothetical protein [Pseudomonas mosselii]MDH1718556.1 hypothetical protein [Pseudomonas mosselii]MDH1723655.1 hypothetical protein [Pseudomonas mosselii]
MDTWKLNDLRELVELRFGRDQKEALAPSLDSVVQRGAFAKYHYLEAKRLLSEATVAHAEPGKIMALILGADDASVAFSQARFRAAAHVTACVQSMHAMADILSHSVYFGLGLNLDASTRLEPHRIDMKNVLKKVSIEHVRQLLAVLTGHEDYQYLSALNNHSKHRSIVTTPYTLDLTEEHKPSGLKFAAFEYGGERFEARWAMPTLDAEYSRQSRLIVGIGQALNASLSTGAL